MIVGDVLSEKMLTDVKVISENCTLRETAERLAFHKIGTLIVVDEIGETAGIVSERDFIRAIAECKTNIADRPVSEIMSRRLITCGPQDSIVNVLNIMKSKGIRHVPVIDEGDIVSVLGIRDLTVACDMLQVQASTDALTGLSNRRSFLKILANEFDRSRRYAHPLSVGFIDIDHFKQVNDTLGHMAGDMVICALGELLVEELRSHDHVGRLGGEEFAVIFPETAIKDAKFACDRLLSKIRVSETKVDETTISFTVSIGLAEANSADRDAEKVLKRADDLMYAAKSGGRDRLVFDNADSASLTEVA